MIGDKKFLQLFLSGLVVSVICVSAQILPTNKMASAQAVKIASKLKAGMEARDAWRFMETNGLAGYTVGGIGYGTTYYQLSDGCSIGLDTEATPGIWTNRILQSAYIQSNRVRIEITLKKRP